MSVPSVSRRLEHLPPSATRAYLPLVKTLQARGVCVHALNIGQPDLCVSQNFYRRLALHAPSVLAYAPSIGYEPLREAIQRYYHRSGIEADGVETLVTYGASEALMMLFDTLCDPGDEVAVYEPFYANYRSMAELKGVVLCPMPTDATITPRIKALLYSSPANPTGVVLSRVELERLVDFARHHNLFLIADEVYREFAFDEQRATSLLEIAGAKECGIVVDSVSKRYSACGARIGWIATHRTDVIDTALKLAQMQLSVPTIEQAAAVSLLDEGDEDVQRAKAAYRSRRDCVVRLLREANIPCTESRGALYLLADIGVDAARFTEYMLTDYPGITEDQETVLTTPARPFYLTSGAGSTEVRIAFVVEEVALTRAIHHLIKGRKAFKEARIDQRS